MHALELKFPPLLLLALFAGAAICVGIWGDGPRFAFPGQLVVAIACGVLGIGFMLSGVLAFSRARTSVNPLDPAVASALVTGGVYRLTRNPMYLGMVLVLAGAVVALGHALNFLLVAAFMLWLTRFQIVPEERFLAARFGADWQAFCARTRRWL